MTLFLEDSLSPVAKLKQEDRSMDRANRVRVNNCGAFMMSLSIHSATGYRTSGTKEYAAGTSETVSTGFYGFSNGREMWPAATILMGKGGHEASQNVIYDDQANATAVYNCGGTSFFPSFSYQGIEQGPTLPPDGARINWNGAIYLLIDRRWRVIPSAETYLRLFRDWNGISSVPSVTGDTGNPLPPETYLGRTSNDGGIYLVTNTSRRHITSMAVFDRYYFNLATLVHDPPGIMALHLGAPIL